VNQEFSQLLTKVPACEVCTADLPLGPRPIVKMAPTSKVLIIGQAPGTKVHESGVPWDDKSGDRLREWLNLPKDTFYDEGQIAIMPMGFCYPGVDKNGGDKPPRPECAPLWHEALLACLPNIELTLLIGAYAQKRYLGKDREKSMTATVANWANYAPNYVPLPHPSWRNTFWLKKNPWFETDLLPVLRAKVGALVDVKS